MATIPTQWLEIIRADPQLRDVKDISQLRQRMVELSAAIKDHPSSAFKQVTFSGETPCPLFKPHFAKRDVGTLMMGRKITDYFRYAIKSEAHVLAALEVMVSSKPSMILKADSAKALGGVYLGGYKSVTSKKWVKKFNITHVVNTAKNLGRHFKTYPKAVSRLKARGVVFLEVPWSDDPKQKITSTQIDEIIAFINGARATGGSVIVHCAQGKSRSGTAMIAYIARTHRLTVEAAMKFVQARRHMVSPNAGFHRQLKELQLQGVFKSKPASAASRSLSAPVLLAARASSERRAAANES